MLIVPIVVLAAVGCDDPFCDKCYDDPDDVIDTDLPQPPEDDDLPCEDLEDVDGAPAENLEGDCQLTIYPGGIFGAEEESIHGVCISGFEGGDWPCGDAPSSGAVEITAYCAPDGDEGQGDVVVGVDSHPEPGMWGIQASSALGLCYDPSITGGVADTSAITITLPMHPSGNCSAYGPLDVELLTGSVLGGSNPDCNLLWEIEGNALPDPPGACVPGTGDLDLQPRNWGDGWIRTVPVLATGADFSADAVITDFQVLEWGDVNKLTIGLPGEDLQMQASGPVGGHALVPGGASLPTDLAHMGAWMVAEHDQAVGVALPRVQATWTCPDEGPATGGDVYGARVGDVLPMLDYQHEMLVWLDRGALTATVGLQGRARDGVVIQIEPDGSFPTPDMATYGAMASGSLSFEGTTLVVHFERIEVDGARAENVRVRLPKR